MVLQGCVDQAAVPLQRRQEWLLPLTGAAVIHLCLLAFVLTAPPLVVSPGHQFEVLPVTLFTAEELASAVSPVSPAAPEDAPVRPRRMKRQAQSSKPVALVRVAPQPPPAALPNGAAPGAAPSPQKSARQEPAAAPPHKISANEATASPGGTGEASAISTGPERAMVLARPRYRDNPSPLYPDQARRRQLEGTVVLEASIGKKGKVDELVIHASSGHRLLDEAALKAVRLWLFEPGRRNGVPIPMKILVPVRFGFR